MRRLIACLLAGLSLCGPASAAVFPDFFYYGGDGKFAAESKARFDAVVQRWMAVRPAPACFVIVGFTDTVGAPETNLLLSARIAEAARDHLLARGVPPADIVVRPRGEADLAVATPDETPEPLNRRVEIRLYPEPCPAPATAPVQTH